MAAPSRTELQDAVRTLIDALYTELDEAHAAVVKLSEENEQLKSARNGLISQLEALQAACDYLRELAKKLDAECDSLRVQLYEAKHAAPQVNDHSLLVTRQRSQINDLMHENASPRNQLSELRMAAPQANEYQGREITIPIRVDGKIVQEFVLKLSHYTKPV